RIAGIFPEEYARQLMLLDVPDLFRYRLLVVIGHKNLGVPVEQVGCLGPFVPEPFVPVLADHRIFYFGITASLALSYALVLRRMNTWLAHTVVLGAFSHPGLAVKTHPHRELAGRNARSEEISDGLIYRRAAAVLLRRVRIGM